MFGDLGWLSLGFAFWAFDVVAFGVACAAEKSATAAESFLDALAAFGALFAGPQLFGSFVEIFAEWAVELIKDGISGDMFRLYSI